MTETDARAVAPVAEASPGGDPPNQPGSTRERILDVALELFVEHGYDGTSLRQIAERLGITKAALYYYFASKDDILMALHMRIHEFGRAELGGIGDEPMTLEVWSTLLSGVMSHMMAQRPLFLLHERNQAAIEKLHHQEHMEAHDDFDTQFRRILADDRVPLEDRVRMAGAFGVVFATIFLAGDAFLSASNDELHNAVWRTVMSALGQ